MKVLAANKRATFDYELLKRIEAGIVLTGHEAKSVRSGRVSISGAHAIIRGGEVFVVGLEIPSFQPENLPPGYDPGRTKKLLLGRAEIDSLSGSLKDGLTLVPTVLYSKGGYLKLELGVGRGKKRYDKREVIRKREVDRDIRRKVKHR